MANTEKPSLSYVEREAANYGRKVGPLVVVAGVEDERVAAAIRRAYEEGYEQGRRDMQPRDAIDM